MDAMSLVRQLNEISIELMNDGFVERAMEKQREALDELQNSISSRVKTSLGIPLTDLGLLPQKRQKCITLRLIKLEDCGLDASSSFRGHGFDFLVNSAFSLESKTSECCSCEGRGKHSAEAARNSLSQIHILEAAAALMFNTGVLSHRQYLRTGYISHLRKAHRTYRRVLGLLYYKGGSEELSTVVDMLYSATMINFACTQYEMCNMDGAIKTASCLQATIALRQLETSFASQCLSIIATLSILIRAPAAAA